MRRSRVSTTPSLPPPGLLSKISKARQRSKMCDSPAQPQLRKTSMDLNSINDWEKWPRKNAIADKTRTSKRSRRRKKMTTAPCSDYFSRRKVRWSRIQSFRRLTAKKNSHHSWPRCGEKPIRLRKRNHELLLPQLSASSQQGKRREVLPSQSHLRSKSPKKRHRK